MLPGSLLSPKSVHSLVVQLLATSRRVSAGAGEQITSTLGIRVIRLQLLIRAIFAAALLAAALIPAW